MPVQRAVIRVALEREGCGGQPTDCVEIAKTRLPNDDQRARFSLRLGPTRSSGNPPPSSPATSTSSTDASGVTWGSAIHALRRILLCLRIHDVPVQRERDE